MPKQRMTALDVAAMVKSIAPLVHRLRVANVYDISSKVYVLKLSDGDAKRHLLLEAGSRFHISDWKRDKQSVPSAFTMKLRQSLRTKRVTGIQQLGLDRVLDLQFGLGENAVHLIVEVYSRGNVVITDHKYVVIAAWRQFKASFQQGATSTELSVKLHEAYPYAQYADISKYELCGLTPAFTCDKADEKGVIKRIQEFMDVRGKGDESLSLFAAIASLFPSAHKYLIQHACEELGIDWKSKIDLEDIPSNSLGKICQVVEKLAQIFATFKHVSTLPDLKEPGLLHSQEAEQTQESVVPGYSHVSVNAVEQVEDFNPIKMAGKPEWIMKRFDTFHQCVDTYFTDLELVRLEKLKSEKTNALEDKVDKIRKDQQERVDKLKETRDLAERQANCLEFHADFAAKALEMVTKIVRSGSDWTDIEVAVKEQRRLNHPIASYIQSLNLKNNRFLLLLEDHEFSCNSQDPNETQPMIPVELVIGESVFANIEHHHDQKKACQLKFSKTLEAAQKVIMRAEAQASQEKAKKELTVESRPAISKLRKTFWFEKFHWFISSDRRLVIAGRDAQQNEILYRKYLQKHDLFVHADVHGAATCIIRNLNGTSMVPERTLEEAGIMSVCRSNAWKSKVITSAYWVFAHQVSKTPQTGEYVSTGGFIIRGKRNPIRVKTLEMAFTVMFCLGDDESINRHREAPNGHDFNQITINGLEKEEVEEKSPGHDGGQNLEPSVVEKLEVSPHADEGLPRDGRPSVGDYPSSRLSVEGADDEAGDSSPPSPMQLDGNDLEALTPPSNFVVGNETEETSYEVLPTPSSFPHVVFATNPPEVHQIEPSAVEDFLHFGDSYRKESHERLGKYFDSRPDSADELPPPEDYSGRTATRDLLAKNTPETRTIALDTLSDDEDDDVATPQSQDWELVERRTPEDRGSGEETPEKKLEFRRPLPAEMLKERKMKFKGNLDKRIRRKLKMMKVKYAEQSDSEREIALQLMGATKLKIERVESDEDFAPVADKNIDGGFQQTETKPDRNIAEEASDDEKDQDWTSRPQAVNELVGDPLEEDTLLFALPMCAPWTAVERNTYKGKLLPGGGKKGQAVQLIQRAFIEMSPKESLQRQLIRAMNADELSLALVANPVVQIPMAKKLQQQDNKAKKALNKALKEAKKLF